MTPGERLSAIETWIQKIGEPISKDVEGLKRALWMAVGGAGVIGTLFGLLAPVILKKLGV